MKIVAISDLHGTLPNPAKMPNGEVLCICGDIAPLDLQNDMVKCTAWFCLDFVPWTDALPYDKVILIAGNHDFFLEDIGPKKGRTPSKTLEALLPHDHKSKHKIVYLCDNLFQYKGVTFYGTPWCANLSRWAFYRPDESSFEGGKGLRDTFDQIPRFCDVILTHQPPRIGNAGVVLQQGQFNSGENYGSQVLAEEVGTRMFKYLLCGHVHSGEHRPYDWDGRTVVNVSLKNEDYDPVYLPFVFDIPVAGEKSPEKV